MKYIRPEYLKDIQNEYKEFFSKKVFRNKPYPVTIEQANDYLLFDVFKVDKKDIITIIEVDKDGNLTEKMTDFTREDYYAIFNYNNWTKIGLTAKITALYWFYEDICKELEIFKPDFYFLLPLPKNYGGYYRNDTHCFCFNLKFESQEGYEENVSAYNMLDVIAHELKHAQFSTIEKTNYFENYNSKLYFPMPQEEDYDLYDDYSKFCYLYDYSLYHFQPTELEAYNYGLNKSKEVFDATNYSKTKDGKKVKRDASLVDLRYFRFQAQGRRADIETMKLIVGGTELADRIDMHNLLNEFLQEIEAVIAEIQQLDPYIKINSKGEILLSDDSNKYLNKLVEHYNQILKEANRIIKEIEKDKKALFKKYREYISKTEIEQLEDIYSK